MIFRSTEVLQNFLHSFSCFQPTRLIFKKPVTLLVRNHLQLPTVKPTKDKILSLLSHLQFCLPLLANTLSWPHLIICFRCPVSKYTTVGLVHFAGYTCSLCSMAYRIFSYYPLFFKRTVMYFMISNGIKIFIDLLSKTLLLKRSA